MRVISLFIGSGDPTVSWISPTRSSERQQMNKLNRNNGGMVLLNWYFQASDLVCNSRNEGEHMVVGRSGQGPLPAPLICHDPVLHPPSTHSGWDRRTAGASTTMCELVEEHHLGPSKDLDEETAAPCFLDYMSATLQQQHCETCTESSTPWIPKNCKNNPKSLQPLYKVSLPFYRC